MMMTGFIGGWYVSELVAFPDFFELFLFLFFGKVKFLLVDETTGFNNFGFGSSARAFDG